MIQRHLEKMQQNKQVRVLLQDMIRLLQETSRYVLPLTVASTISLILTNFIINYYSYVYCIVFIHIHYLKSFETGDMKYVMMFAAIGFGVALVIVLVVVACVRKSKSSTANGV